MMPHFCVYKSVVNDKVALLLWKTEHVNDTSSTAKWKKVVNYSLSMTAQHPSAHVLSIFLQHIHDSLPFPKEFSIYRQSHNT